MEWVLVAPRRHLPTSRSSSATIDMQKSLDIVAVFSILPTRGLGSMFKELRPAP